MKEATGELNMTVVTIIAIAAVGALFYVFVWPMIQKSIVNQTCRTYGTDFEAVSVRSFDEGTQATVKVWKCCRGGDTNAQCYDTDYGTDVEGGTGGGTTS